MVQKTLGYQIRVKRIVAIPFLLVLFIVCEKEKLSLKVFLMGLVASILPFGPFVFDYKLKKLAQ